MLRKITATLLICFSMLLYFNNSFAEIQPIKVNLNGDVLNFDVNPIIIEGRTMLPLRTVFEAFGFTIEWNSMEKKVVGEKRDSKVELYINNKIAKINGKEYELDVAATIIDGRTLAPVRFIAESVGAKVDWDGSTRTVMITYYQKGDIKNIDYSNTDKYVLSGGQSIISDEYFLKIYKQLRIKTKEISDIKKIFEWKNKNFNTVSTGGKYIGKITSNQLIEKKELTGCHDHALILASVLRRYGFPTLMVDTCGIE